MEELLEQLIAYVGADYSADQDTFLLTLLEDAAEEVCNYMYPWGIQSDKEREKLNDIALKRYGRKIRKIAEYHYDKQGRAGTIGWSENGASISYETAGTPSSYFYGIIPIAKIV